MAHNMMEQINKYEKYEVKYAINHINEYWYQNQHIFYVYNEFRKIYFKNIFSFSKFCLKGVWFWCSGGFYRIEEQKLVWAISRKISNVYFLEHLFQKHFWEPFFANSRMLIWMKNIENHQIFWFWRQFVDISLVL